MILKRAISIDQMKRMKFKTMEFKGAFANSIGETVERSGSWMFYGESGHGKTEFTLQLARYLANFGRVAYNTLEEGARLTFQNAIERQPFTKKEQRNFIILSEPIEELSFRLKLQKAPDFIIIDSVQYSGLTRIDYKKLIATFPNKLFIWISHTEGRKPQGRLAQQIEYHADVKGRVEGFKAILKSRYQGFEDYVINAERAAEYWNELS